MAGWPATEGALSRNASGLRKDQRRNVQTEPVIRPDQALQQPASEKARTAGNKQPLPAQFIPQNPGVIKDVIQVFSRQQFPSPSFVFVQNQASHLRTIVPQC
jgi:hypothetical protein